MVGMSGEVVELEVLLVISPPAEEWSTVDVVAAAFCGI